MHIERIAGDTLRRLLQVFPVAALSGPSHSGATTLARKISPTLPRAPLSDARLRARAEEDPAGLLAGFPDGAFLDDIHLAPALLPHVLERASADGRMGLFLLAGHGPAPGAGAAGRAGRPRMGVLALHPPTFEELAAAGVAPAGPLDAVFQGSHPPLLPRGADAAAWLADHTARIAGQEAPLLRDVDPAAFLRFMRLAAGRTGQLLNLSSLGADSGITHVTAGAWLEVLEACGLAFQLPPCPERLSRRLIRTTRLYFHDSGLACSLLGIEHAGQLATHPLRGQLFATWVVSELARSFLHRGKRPPLHFWRDKEGNTVDLVIGHPEGWLPVDIRSGETVPDDALDRLGRWRKIMRSGPQGWLVHGGSTDGEHAAGRLCPWHRLPELVRAVAG